MNRKILGGREPLGGVAVAAEARCRVFLDRYSDYRDDRLDDEGRSFFLAHMAECGSCERYDRVIRKGVAALRRTEPASPRPRVGIGGVRLRGGAFREEGPALEAARSVVTLGVTVLVALFAAATAWTPASCGLCVDAPEVGPAAATAGASAAPDHRGLEAGRGSSTDL